MRKIKFHVNPETGEVGDCTASIRDCKYSNGTNENHYATREEAEHAGQVVLQDKYGTFNQMKKSKNVAVTSMNKNKLDSFVETLDKDKLNDFVNSSSHNFNTFWQHTQDRIEKNHDRLKRAKALSPHIEGNKNPIAAINYDSIMRDYEIDDGINSELVLIATKSKYYSDNLSRDREQKSQEKE